MWDRVAVCELVAMNLSSFAASAGLRPLIFAAIVGSNVTLFASPRLTVCGPLHLPTVSQSGIREKPTLERGETHATSAAIKIGALQCDRPHHGVDRAPDVLLSLKHPRTLRTAGLRALAFTLVSMLDHRLGDAPSELLA